MNVTPRVVNQKKKSKKQTSENLKGNVFVIVQVAWLYAWPTMFLIKCFNFSKSGYTNTTQVKTESLENFDIKSGKQLN